MREMFAHLRAGFSILQVDNNMFGRLYKCHFRVGTWLSLVEHSVRDAGAGGSNPLVPTIFIAGFYSDRGLGDDDVGKDKTGCNKRD